MQLKHNDILELNRNALQRNNILEKKVNNGEKLTIEKESGEESEDESDEEMEDIDQ